MKKIIMTAAVGLLLLSSSFAELIKTKAIPNTTIKMGLTEVTVEQYVAITGENPGNIYWEHPIANRPVDSVCWYDCVIFCNKLSVKEGLEPVYSVNGDTDVANWQWVDDASSKLSNIKKIKASKTANGYRLPNVKEWATACKGEDKYKYPGSDNLAEVAWYRDTANIEKNGNKYYSFETRAVGTKKANENGIYDMCGNVSEWANDIPLFPDIQFTLSNLIMSFIKGYYPTRVAMGTPYNESKEYCATKKLVKAKYYPAGMKGYSGMGFRVCVADPNAAKAEEKK